MVTLSYSYTDTSNSNYWPSQTAMSSPYLYVRRSRYYAETPITRADRRAAFKRDYRIEREREAKQRREKHVVRLDVAISRYASAAFRHRHPRFG